jgi:hypothetical protein
MAMRRQCDGDATAMQLREATAQQPAQQQLKKKVKSNARKYLHIPTDTSVDMSSYF